MVRNKIRALLALYGLSMADYARALDIKPQSLNTKANANAYKLSDLVRLAELTGTRLAFLDETGAPLVVLGSDDLEP